AAAAASHVRDVGSIGRPHRHSQRNACIPLEGDLAAAVGFEIQNPYVSVTSAITQVCDLLVVRTYRRSLHGTGLMSDLNSLRYVRLGVIAHRVFPNIKLNP